MTEIPEHLRKRAEAARAKAAEKAAADEPAETPAGDARRRGRRGRRAASPAASRPTSSSGPRPPRRRRRVPPRPARRGCRPPVVAWPRPWPTAAPPPTATGPGGHTQRLLTVVKAGSIQDVKSTPVDKVHTWPHLLAAEFVAALSILAFTLIFSIFVNAPLLEMANPNKTPNPSKAPWYFLGLQELLTMFHPMVAGVTIPGMGIFLLILAPYIDRNPSNKPEDRKFAIALFTLFLMFWAVLVMIGSFFRGEGQNFVAPWTQGLFFDL